jgi:hypothetical protein
MIRGLRNCSIRRFRQASGQVRDAVRYLGVPWMHLCVEPLAETFYLRPNPMLTANIYLKLF